MSFRLNPFTGEFDEIGSSGGAGSGDVVGPASATDNAIALFDGTSGKLIQNSSATYSAGVLSIGELNLTTDLAVQYGGTGRSSATAYAVVCGGTTGTGAHQSVSGVGTSGQVLTSNGAGALPTWQAAPGGTTTFDDSTFRIYDNVDNTKEIAFEASGITTATTRTVTMPDQNVDLTPTSGTFQGSDADLTALAALSGTGLLSRTGAATYAERTLQQPAAGITVTNGDGVSGDPTLALANDLAALEGLASTGIAVRSAADTWVQRSVAGTTDQIDVANGSGAAGNPTISIASTYAGQTSIVTLGTVTTGTWNGTTIDVANGGSGRTSATAYAVICGGTTGTGAHQSIASVGTAGQVLTSNGAGALPTFQAATATDVLDSTFRIQDNVDNTKEIAFEASGITTATTRTITMADQNIDLTPTTGSYQASDADLTALAALSGTGMLSRTGAATYAERTITGTADKIDVTNGDGVSGAPTLTIASTYAGQTSIVTLGTVTTGTWNGTTIDVANGGTGATSHTAYAVLCGGTTGTGAVQSIASVGSAGQVLTSNGAGALPTFQAAGAGSSPLTTKGDLYTYDTADARLAVGTNDQALIADSAQSTGIKWGVLQEAGGGTAQSTYTTGDMLYASASNTLSKLAIGDHYPNIIVQNSSGVPQWKQDHLLLENDFLGLGGWQYDNNSGTGLFTTGVSGHPGIFTLGTSTSASGRAILSCGTTTSTPPYIFAGDGLTVFDAIVRIPTLSTVSEEFELFIGFMTSTAFSTPPGSNVICFRYDRTTSTDWDGLCISAGSSTTASGGTGTAVDTNWTHLRFIINAGGTNVDFFVDGVDIGSVTTNIPTSTGMVISNYIFKTAGTTQRTVNIDYNRVYKELTTSRFA